MLFVCRWTFYIFEDLVLKNGEISCRCGQKKLKCKTRVYTVGPDNFASRNNGVHNHETGEQKLNQTIVSNVY